MSSHQNEGGLDRRDLLRRTVLGGGADVLLAGEPSACAAAVVDRTTAPANGPLITRRCDVRSRTARPIREQSRFDVMSRLFAAPSRQNAVLQAERKTALGAAPAYLYWFTWQTPVLDGRPRAFHCSELPFVFDNTDRCAAMTGGTPEARALRARISDAWIAFARKGDPNHPSLPKWPVFSPDKGPVVILDNGAK
jgi:carboxylesterase type B